VPSKLWICAYLVVDGGHGELRSSYQNTSALYPHPFKGKTLCSFMISNVNAALNVNVNVKFKGKTLCSFMISGVNASLNVNCDLVTSNDINLI
jgi:hypothetical protein